MPRLGDTHRLCMEYPRALGHPDFIGGIDNEALDFGQLESFLHVATTATTSNHSSTAGSIISLNTNNQQQQIADGIVHHQAANIVVLPPIHHQSVATHSSAASVNGLSSSTTSNSTSTNLQHSLAPNDVAAAASTMGNGSQHDSGSEQSSAAYSPSDLHHGVASSLTMGGMSPDDHQLAMDLEHGLSQHHHQHHHHMQHHPSLLGGLVFHKSLSHTSDVSSIEDCIQSHSPTAPHLLDIGGCRDDKSCSSLRSYSSATLPPDDAIADAMLPLPSLPAIYQQLHPNGGAPAPTALLLDTISPTTATPNATQQQQQRRAPSTGASARKRKIVADKSVDHSDVKPEPALSPLEPLSPNPSLLSSSVAQMSANSLPSATPTKSCLGGGGGGGSDAISNADASSSTHNSDSGDTCAMQCIRFAPFQPQNWHTLCDQSLQDLPTPHYRVDADKGFNFSTSDDAFVCQKKNHFQVTCHAQLQGAAAAFVRTTAGGLEKVRSFHLHFYGVKLETPTQTIRVEQSQSDRSKKPFHPVLLFHRIDLQNRQVSKVTVGRLHFSETTSNNMRKKGRPNPEQRYFQLVVGLHAHTHSGHFPVISHGSERIIVRASNPGQFESDVELCWQRGVTQDSVYHAGRVGINTDRPDESLVVHGNLKVSGHIVQPSDSRAKREIGELDTAEQLRNVQRIRVVKYRYEPEFAVHSGLWDGRRESLEAVGGLVDTGVIAQEVREVLPDAVQEAGSVRLASGQVIEQFLFVNKDRIYMENIGAVKELCKVTGSLETRIEQLERINARLARMPRGGGDNFRKTCSIDGRLDDPHDERDHPEMICSNKTIQTVIVLLVIIMAACLAAISTLYFVEHQNSYLGKRPDMPHHQYQPPSSSNQQPTQSNYQQQQLFSNTLDTPPDAHQPKHQDDRTIGWSSKQSARLDYGQLILPLPVVVAAPVPPPPDQPNSAATKGHTTAAAAAALSTPPQLVDDPAEPNVWLPEVDSNLIDTGHKLSPKAAKAHGNNASLIIAINSNHHTNANKPSAERRVKDAPSVGAPSVARKKEVVAAAVADHQTDASGSPTKIATAAAAMAAAECCNCQLDEDLLLRALKDNP